MPAETHRDAFRDNGETRFMENNRVYLIDGRKNSYKANLHCHTTVSDGKYTPEEIKELYKSRGYQIVAYTDHEVLVLHDDLNDGEFLAMPGYEIQIYGDLELPKRLRRVCHLNLYPKDSQNNVMPFYNEADVLKLDNVPDISKAVYVGDGKEPKEYSAEGLNRLIAKARDAGFIVSYNHPTWSRENSDIYMGLRGLYAMEIYNHGTSFETDAYCPYVYDEMLISGQSIGCVATDDTHNERDMFGGFTMIYSDKFEHSAVIEALENGDYYASRGPLIKELWYENGIFHIECSPAVKIRVSNSCRRAQSKSLKISEKADITVAEFPIQDIDVFVRFTVEDEFGRTANTRAYWRDEFETSLPIASNVKNYLKQ